MQDCQSFPANSGAWQEIAGARNLNLSPIQSHFRERQEPLSGLLESNECLKIDSAIRSSMIIDVQGEDISEIYYLKILPS